jgi:hypothetical protein
MAAVRKNETARWGLDQSLMEAVEVGRRMGCSWADVGEAFGVSRQAACNRWGRTLERRAGDRPS